MKKFFIPGIVVALFAFMVVPATASIGLVVEGGGTQQVYQLTNGNFLGLWGFDNRGAGQSDVTFNSAADITSIFTSNGGSVVNYYNGTNPINAGASEFDALAFSFTVLDQDRLFDSLWVEWTGGNLVARTASGGTSTMSELVTRSGDPLQNVIPEPGTLAIWGVGLGVMAIGRRRRQA